MLGLDSRLGGGGGGKKGCGDSLLTLDPSQTDPTLPPCNLEESRGEEEVYIGVNIVIQVITHDNNSDIPKYVWSLFLCKLII